MKLVNMKAHPTKKHLNTQFEIMLDEVNFSRLNSGIISDTIPNKETSPLGCSLLSLRTDLVLEVAPSYAEYQTLNDTILINAWDSNNDGSLTSEDVGVLVRGNQWDYQFVNEVFNLENTLDSICSALNSITGIKASIQNLVIVITGINKGLGFRLKNCGDRLTYISYSRILIKAGSVIFPSGYKGTLENDTLIPVEVSSNNLSGKVLAIVVRNSFIEKETGLDEFGNTVTKSYYIPDISSLITTELVEESGPSGDALCLGIIKPFEQQILIDSQKNEFSYLRPWYSAKDVKHRVIVGTGGITKHNPHGIDYNDIDSDNTIHNQLLSEGKVVSPPTDIQNQSGHLKTYTITTAEIRADVDKKITNSYSTDIGEGYLLNRYFVLPEIPLSINSIVNEDGIPIALTWIEGTSTLIIPDGINGQTFIIEYLFEPSLHPSVSNKGKGVSLEKIESCKIAISKGKRLSTTQELVSFDEVSDLDKMYSVYLNSDGEAVKIPSTEIITTLDTSSSDLPSLVSRSRIEVTIKDTPYKKIMDCPTKEMTYSCSDTVFAQDVYQTFCLVGKTISNGILTNSLITESIASSSHATVPSQEVTSTSSVTCSNSGNKTYQLPATVIYSSLVLTNTTTKTELEEGTDYTLNSTTGLVSYTVYDSSSLQAINLNDVLSFTTDIKGNITVSLETPIQDCPIYDTFEKSYLGKTNEHTYELYTGKNVKIPRRTGNVVTGGIKIDIVISNVSDIANLTTYLQSPDGTIVRLFGTNTILSTNSPLCDVSNSPLPVLCLTIETDAFDDIAQDGNWIFTICDSQNNSLSNLDYLKIKWNFAKVLSNVYSVREDEDGNTITKKVNSEYLDSSSPTYNFYNDSGDESNLYDTSDFSVTVALHGEADNETITEELVFDSSYRDQEGKNVLFSENVFDSLDKYTVTNNSSTGTLIIVAYPIGSIGSLCGVFSAKYKDRKISDLTDIRRVGTTIQDNQNKCSNNSIIADATTFIMSLEDL